MFWKRKVEIGCTGKGFPIPLPHKNLRSNLKQC